MLLTHFSSSFPHLLSLFSHTHAEAAHFKSKFRAETYRRSESGRLTCEAFGERPIRMQWTKDGQPLLFDSQRFVPSFTYCLLHESLLCVLVINYSSHQMREAFVLPLLCLCCCETLFCGARRESLTQSVHRSAVFARSFYPPLVLCSFAFRAHAFEPTLEPLFRNLLLFKCLLSRFGIAWFST